MARRKSSWWRLIDPNGDFVGVAAVFIDVGYLQQIFNSLQMPPGTSITAFNRDGHVVVRMPAIISATSMFTTDFSRSSDVPQLPRWSPAGSFARFTF